VKSETSPVGIEWPVSVARAVRFSCIAGYGLALAGFIIPLGASDLSVGRSLYTGIVVGMLLAVPATLALLSQPRRPLMLLPAAMIGFAGLFGVLSVLGLPLIVLAAIWFWADVKVVPRGLWSKRLAMIVVPLLWLAAASALWAHIDPACEQQLSDGTVVSLDPATRSMEGGWVWQMSDTVSGTGSSSPDVVSEVCDSNVVVPWEAALSILLGGIAVLYAYWTAGPSQTTHGEVAIGEMAEREAPDVPDRGR
jgi:hypothetical protein